MGLDDKKSYTSDDQENVVYTPLPYQEAPVSSDEQQAMTNQNQPEAMPAQARPYVAKGNEVPDESPQPDVYTGSQDGTVLRQDGYRDTEGSTYGESKSSYGQPQGGKGPAEQGFDPAHSGAQPAKNVPGTKIDAPGRETGTAWGEDQQMGYTTDTPDRRNPAG